MLHKCCTNSHELVQMLHEFVQHSYEFCVDFQPISLYEFARTRMNSHEFVQHSYEFCVDFQPMSLYKTCMKFVQIRATFIQIRASSYEFIRICTNVVGECKILQRGKAKHVPPLSQWKLWSSWPRSSLISSPIASLLWRVKQAPPHLAPRGNPRHLIHLLGDPRSNSSWLPLMFPTTSL
jgi:hypothetical protein